MQEAEYVCVGAEACTIFIQVDYCALCKTTVLAIVIAMTWTPSNFNAMRFEYALMIPWFKFECNRENDDT